MQFTTPVNIKSNKTIDHNSRIVMLGSCFAENIGKKLIECGFNVVMNPMGILYNPISIHNALTRIIENREFTEDELFYHNGLWASFMHHGSFSHSDKNEALKMMNERLHEGHEQLKNATHLIITFGSAEVYEHNNNVVSNCHKLPSRQFTHRLLSINEIIDIYKTRDTRHETRDTTQYCPPVLGGRAERRGLSLATKNYLPVLEEQALGGGGQTNNCPPVLEEQAIDGEGQTNNCPPVLGGRAERRGLSLATNNCPPVLEEQALDGGGQTNNCPPVLGGRAERRGLSLSTNNCPPVLEEQTIGGGGQKLSTIFTISPVRYLSEGAHHGQINKSTLLLATDQICREMGADYFPSYEIMMDELRDYRYYATDMIHPSDVAIDYIFERFTETYLTNEAIRIAEEIKKIKKSLAHRPLHPDSEEYQNFKKKLSQQIAAIAQKYPNVKI